MKPLYTETRIGWFLHGLRYKNTFPIPLYTAPPKREPLSASTIEYYLLRLDSDFKWDSGFEAGVKWAEKAHGIGVDDE